MLSSIFQKRRKIQELRSPALQDIKKFRDVYARNAERRHVETPSCLEKSVYKAISCQKELHSVDFRQEDITDPQLIALAETLLEMPMISYLDLRDNRITDDGAKALLEVLRLQIIAAKTPLKTDPKTKLPIIPSVPEYTRYVTQVLIKGNEVSAAVLQELAQYTEILKREDKRVEIRAALAQIDRNSSGGIDEDEFKAVLKLLTGAEPSRKEVKMLMQQHTQSSENLQKSAINLENLLLAKCSASPSKKAACPPWEALVQVRHATLGQHHHAAQLAKAKSAAPSELSPSSGDTPQSAVTSVPMHRAQSQPISQRLDAPSIQVSSASSVASSSSVQRSAIPSDASSMNAKLAMAMPPPPPPPAQVLTSPTHSQQQSPVSSRSSSSDQSSSVLAKLRADFKPPASPPPLSLTSTAPLVSSSPDTKGAGAQSHQSFASSSAREPHDNASVVVAESSARDTPRALALSSGSSTDAPVASIRSASSPDRASVYSSSSSFSQYIGGLDAPRQPSSLAPQAAAPRTSDETVKKLPVPSLPTVSSVISESPRWRDEDVFTDDEDDSDGDDDPVSGGGEHDAVGGDQALAEDTGRSAARMAESHVTADSTTLPGTAAAGLSTKPERRRRMDSGTITSDVVELSDGEGDAVLVHRPSRTQSDATSSSNERDLSSLIYREATDSAATSRRQRAPPRLLLTRPSDGRAADPETNDDDNDSESDEHFDAVIADVMKNGKPRSVARITHSALKRGLLLKDVPSDVPFRNLVALTLSENGLSSLDCLKECRFPCATVLDLSKNRLAKIGDDDLVGFPKLQVLDLAHNRLRSFQGLGHAFDLRALNGNHNAMKTVKNIEHLVQLQVLQVASNFIGNIAALRLLSLNKMLTHVDLDANPIVETDERQKRRNIVHILNLIPTLRSLGSIPVASLHSKEKKLKSSASAVEPVRGKALYDVDSQFPGYEALWTTRVCEVLQCFQDVLTSVKTRSSYNNDESDDPWGRDDGSADRSDTSAQHVRKPLNSRQQRQRDELRSRAVGYRSRAKAIPSPPKVKTSVYSFGPPVPPPPPSATKPAKKAPPTDPRVAKQQQRRASELSAPKHQPVDTALLSQEQKRKSRPTFDVNMSVAERLLLAQEKAQRRSSSSSSSKRTSVIAGGGRATMHRAKSVVVANGTSMERSQQSEDLSRGSESSRSQSPIPAKSPMQGVVAFRIEPLPSRNQSPAKSGADNASPRRALAVSDNSSASTSADSRSPTARPASPTLKMFAAAAPPSPPKPAARESSFLQDLAVTDFLTHADEELSTALTALNVLLRMCEREQSDAKKLAEYRSSLEALDILDERESHALFAKTRDYVDHARASECAQAFAELGTVKQSLRALLAELEAHAPGSDAVRAFCRSLRSSELRSILSAPEIGGDADGHDTSKSANSDVCTSNETLKASSAPVSAPASGLDCASVASTVASVDLEETSDAAADVSQRETHALRSQPLGSETQATVAHSSTLPTTDAANDANDNGEDEFDFLSNDRSVFDDNEDDDDGVSPEDQATARSFTGKDSVESEYQSVEAQLQLSDVDGALEAAAASSYAITQEIQQRDDDDEWLSDAPADGDLACSGDAGPVETNALESSDLVDDAATEMPVQTHEDDADDDAWLATEASALGDVAADASEFGGGDTGAGVPDDDWLASETAALDGVDGVGADVDTLSSAFEDEFASVDTTLLCESSDAVSAVAAPTEDSGDVDIATDVPYDNDISEALEPVATSDCEDEGSLSVLETALATDDDETAVAGEPPLSEAEDADDEEAEMFGDWEKGFDPNTNHYFWFNHATGESAWTPPEDWPFEVDTPFETEDEYCGDGAEASDAYDAAQDDGEAVQNEQGHECAGEDRALDSSHRALSDVDDDLFSDQDLPSF